MPTPSPLTGAVDGVNGHFTAAAVIEKELLFVDHAFQMPGVDYTAAGVAIDFAPGSIPPVGAKLTLLNAFLVSEVPPDAVDGVNAAFTAAADLVNELVMVDHQFQINGLDYIVVGEQALFQVGSVPPLGSVVRIFNGGPFFAFKPLGPVDGANAVFSNTKPFEGEIAFVDHGYQIPGYDYVAADEELQFQAGSIPPGASIVVVFNDTAPAEEPIETRLLQQYRDATAPGVLEVAVALRREVAALTKALASFDNVLPPGAVGVQLDRLGKIIGEPRNGRSDSAYLPWILAKIAANRSSGSIEDIIRVFKALIGSDASGKVLVEEYFPAGITVHIFAALAGDDPVQAAAILRLAKKAGVGANLVYVPVDSAHAFSFDGGADGLGWGDSTDPSVGGALAGAVGA